MATTATAAPSPPTTAPTGIPARRCRPCPGPRYRPSLEACWPAESAPDAGTDVPCTGDGDAAAGGALPCVCCAVPNRGDTAPGGAEGVPPANPDGAAPDTEGAPCGVEAVPCGGGAGWWDGVVPVPGGGGVGNGDAAPGEVEAVPCGGGAG